MGFISTSAASLGLGSADSPAWLPLSISLATTGTNSTVNVARWQVPTGSGTTNVHVLLSPKGSGGIIAGPPPDGTTTGGNARGLFSLDLQRTRAAANQVADAGGAVILTGYNNRVTSPFQPENYGLYSSVLSGYGNTISGFGNGSAVAGAGNTLTGNSSFGAMFVFGSINNVTNGSTSGGTLVVLGEQHIGGGTNVTYLGGFHNWADGAGVGAQGNTIERSGLGGMNMTLTGAGVQSSWQGSNAYTGHGNKDRERVEATLTRYGSVANGGTLNQELFFMEYPPTCSFLPAAVDTGTDVITCNNSYAANAVTRISSTGTIPAGLAADTDYYVVNPTATTFQLSTTSGGAAIDITTQGTGLLHTFNNSTSFTKWMRLIPRRVYTIEFELIQALVSATTPTYSIRRFRGNWYQPNSYTTAPTLVGSITAIENAGSDAGAPPAGWGYAITETVDGLHLVGTIVNNDGATRSTSQYCRVVSVSMSA